MLSEKTCTLCKETKQIIDFSFDQRNNRHLARCKLCISRKTAEWRKRNYEKYRSYNKEWNEQNYNKTLASKRKYRDANKEEIKAKSRLSSKENPQWSVRRTLIRRRNFANCLKFKISAKEIYKLRAANCFYCEKPGPSELDHVIPISRGGSHGIGNLLPACRFCNASKSDQTIMEWRTK
jgi:5-methylcytosine-specific restriction endonuclease McrA